jgi:beta-glucosidase
MPDLAAPPLTLSDWPVPARALTLCPRTETLITRLLNWLTPAQKVGQIIQADIASVTPEDIATYHLGAVLNGGNSAPNGKQTARLSDWLDLADAFWTASMRADGPRIPVLWGTDAVHGHNNLLGATIFPHNINLGATRDASLVERIGVATAREVRATGMDWTFAPSVAVARDLRWGRTYESYAEDPALVAELGAALVRGLQGNPLCSGFLGPDRIIATAKHFIGDGGTLDGRDQGDTPATEHQLRDIHAPGYQASLAAGVQTVMASFSSWQGRKMHGHKALLTDLLKTHWQFDGVVVGDWDGHGQLPDASTTDCPDALMAGLDMYMAPGSWKGLHASLLGHLQSGRITLHRLDDAVRRILRLKFRAGLFDAPKPSSRISGSPLRLLGSQDHADLAAEAVRKSAVLLKNSDRLLPLNPAGTILVSGSGADDLGMACGGWTLSWQGGRLDSRDYPHAETVLTGIHRIVRTAGGKVLHRPDGRFRRRPDVAIHVFGERPYAEFRGDLSTLDDRSVYRRDAEILQRLRGAGIPTLAIFLSGRPLWINPELNAATAFVAAFLPGTSAGALADLIFAPGGTTTHDFTGRLPFAWPEFADQYGPEAGPGRPNPLFPFGYGLSLGDDGSLRMLHEDSVVTQPDHGTMFAHGMTAGSWQVRAGARGTPYRWAGKAQGPVPDGLTLRAADLGQQENAIEMAWSGSGDTDLVFTHAPLDLTREANAGFCLAMTLARGWGRHDAPNIALVCRSGRQELGNVFDLPIVERSRSARIVEIPLKDLVKNGMDLSCVEGVALWSDKPARLVLSHLGFAMGRG